MTAVRNITVSGDDYIDGLIADDAWDPSSLTFSFPASASNYGAYGDGFDEPDTFVECTSTQKANVRAALARYAEYVNLTFNEITETDVIHATLRYANSDAPSSAWAYYPVVSEIGGDVWFDAAGDLPEVGNYDYHTMLHETGHALGLKHGHEVGGLIGPIPLDKDGQEYTVMTYRSYVGGGSGGYTLETNGYPTTPMQLDIAALQYMYGPNTAIRSSGAVVHINPTTAVISIGGVPWMTPTAVKLFATLPWVNGGNYELDLSDFTTDLDVNLGPGEASVLDDDLLPDLGSGNLPAGNIYVPLQYASGTASLPNRVRPGSGDNVIVGNARDCTLALDGERPDYTATDEGGGMWTVADTRAGTPNGSNTISNFEFVEFTDETVAVADLRGPRSKLRMKWAA